MSLQQQRLFVKFLEAGIPVLLTGPPGTGKTGFVKALEKRRILDKPVKVIQLMASIREPADLGGYPVPDMEKGYVSLMPVSWGIEAMQAYDDGYFVIIFPDELRNVTAPSQGALMKGIHENLVGDLQMPDGIRWGAAANSVEESAGGVPLEPPMANRFAHIPWKPNATEWAQDMTLNKYALQSPLSEEAQKRLPKERALVASFIARKPSAFLNIPKGAEDRDGPWPSPRTLDYTAHAWTVIDEEDFDTREEAMAACVGLSVASEFVQFLRTADLPDPEDVIAGKFTAEQLADPVRPDRTYAILYSMVSRIADNWTPDRYESGWKMFGEMTGQAGVKDIAGALVPTLFETQVGKPSVPAIGKHVLPFLDLLKRAGYKPNFG